MKRHFLAAFVLFSLMLMMACGGGGGGSTRPPVIPPTPPPVITITTASLPGGTIGTAYSIALTASGGTLPYKWDLTVGSLPPGLSLSQDGVISGTVPVSLSGTTQSVQVRVTDSAATPNTAFKPLNVDILGFGPTSLGYAQVGEQYGVKSQVTATGGTEPLHWSSSGNVPPGIILEQIPGTQGTRSYFLYGKPSQSGTYQFSITVTDSSSPARTLTLPYSVDVEPAVLKFSETRLPVAVVGQPYSYTFSLNGGQGPFTMQLMTVRPLPDGLSFDEATGTLSGTPTTPDYSSFGIYVSDRSQPFTQSTNWQSFRLLVVSAPLTQHNDSIATAVPIFPGTYEASISPYRDQVGNAAPDQDYYQMTLQAGSTVQVTVSNQLLKYWDGFRTSLLDPVVELVDANGHRLVTCNDPLDDNPPAGTPLPQDTTPNGFDDPCMNWSSDGENFGSAASARLTFKAPGSSGDVTYYIHVFDWRGDARPDMFYTMDVTQQ